MDDSSCAADHLRWAETTLRGSSSYRAVAYSWVPIGFVSFVWAMYDFEPVGGPWNLALFCAYVFWCFACAIVAKTVRDEENREIVKGAKAPTKARVETLFETTSALKFVVYAALAAAASMYLYLLQQSDYKPTEKNFLILSFFNVGGGIVTVGKLLRDAQLAEFIASERK